MSPTYLHMLAVVAVFCGLAWAAAAEPAASPAPVRDLHKKVVLPVGYDSDPARRWPVWVHLHGAWPRKEGELSVVEQEDVYKAVVAAQPPAILVAPLCPPDQGWESKELAKLLDSLTAEYRIDPTRVYLSGGSMGGYGAYAFAKEQSERLAAMIILCGSSELRGSGALKGLPIWAFHGLRDEYVPFVGAQQLIQSIVNTGGSVRFTIYGDLGHDIGKRATAEPDFVSWMLAQRRSPAK